MMNDVSTKLYYNQREVAGILCITPQLLRYWLKMYPMLVPKTKKNGRVVYGEKDISLLKYAKQLIVDDGLNAKTVRKKLEDLPHNRISQQTIVAEQQLNATQSDVITFTKEEFAELLGILQLVADILRRSRY